MRDGYAGVATFWRRSWVELGWFMFVAANLVGILFLRSWATVPFHFIWISLSFIYGWRIWGLRVTAVILGLVVVTTGVSLIADVVTGDQAPDELTEIPLMSAVFVAMVWYVRRSVTAQRELERISERNAALLRQEQRFIQEASHALRTPLTIALGHAEMLQRTTSDEGAAADASVVIGELNRLSKVTDRLLALASSEQPDFVRPTPTSVREIVTRTLARWNGTTPALRVGRVDDAVVALDPDRIVEALDELIGNAIRHTPAGTPVHVRTWPDGEWQVLTVIDDGPGIPEERLAQIFQPWVRLVDGPGQGVGLGLAIVKAVVEAHGGSVRALSAPGDGATFEMRLPLAPVQPSGRGVVDTVGTHHGLA